MDLEHWEDIGKKYKSEHISCLTVICPICGKEFACNKTYHVYTALIRRKRQYYCSYSCYKQRPNPKEKR